MKKTSPNTTSSSNLDLPDINVWLALVDENHSLHLAAGRYWAENRGVDTAFCRVSMLGFLRLSTRSGVLTRTLSHEQAWDTYRRFMELPEVRFLTEPASAEHHFATLTLRPGLPHHLWTDAYLAAFAFATGARLVSFDTDFRRFPGLNFLHLTA